MVGDAHDAAFTASSLSKRAYLGVADLQYCNGQGAIIPTAWTCCPTVIGIFAPETAVPVAMFLMVVVTASSPPITPTSNQTGAIVGGVFGGLLALAILTGGLAMFLRRRSRKQGFVRRFRFGGSDFAQPAYLSRGRGFTVAELDDHVPVDLDLVAPKRAVGAPLRRARSLWTPPVSSKLPRSGPLMAPETAAAVRPRRLSVDAGKTSVGAVKEGWATMNVEVADDGGSVEPTRNIDEHWLFRRLAEPLGSLSALSVTYTGTDRLARSQFIPSGGRDEIALNAGDHISIKEVFRDGYGMGWNRSTQTFGMFPLDYLTFEGAPADQAEKPIRPLRTASSTMKIHSDVFMERVKIKAGQSKFSPEHIISPSSSMNGP
ncbi:hypothetical protein HDU93_008775 [Gonapodya sp. JEL0774]|nr:hypothetical protein HDU93_008775 [Gonapodya sp. JEL0774]